MHIITYTEVASSNSRERTLWLLEIPRIYLILAPANESLIQRSLDNQHNFLIEICGGKLIHKSIHEDQIFSVADVATGTG